MRLAPWAIALLLTAACIPVPQPDPTSHTTSDASAAGLPGDTDNERNEEGDWLGLHTTSILVGGLPLNASFSLRLMSSEPLMSEALTQELVGFPTA